MRDDGREMMAEGYDAMRCDGDAASDTTRRNESKGITADGTVQQRHRRACASPPSPFFWLRLRQTAAKRYCRPRARRNEGIQSPSVSVDARTKVTIIIAVHDPPLRASPTLPHQETPRSARPSRQPDARHRAETGRRDERTIRERARRVRTNERTNKIEGRGKGRSGSARNRNGRAVPIRQRRRRSQSVFGDTNATGTDTVIAHRPSSPPPLPYRHRRRRRRTVASFFFVQRQQQQ